MQTALLNFRDLGGLRSDDGRFVRVGHLYRSDDIGALPHAEWDRLQADLGLRVAIDMRSGFEDGIVGGARTIDDGVVVHRIPILDGSMAEMAERGQLDLDEVYRRIAIDSADTIAGGVRLLARADSLPALVFCTAGKDRTGVLVAVMLAAIGVVREDIVADYTQSALAGQAMRDRFSLRFGDRVAAVPPAMFDAPAPVIERLLDGIERDFGTAARYLVDHGVTIDDLDRLAAALLA